MFQYNNYQKFINRTATCTCQALSASSRPTFESVRYAKLTATVSVAHEVHGDSPLVKALHTMACSGKCPVDAVHDKRRSQRAIAIRIADNRLANR